MVSHVLARVPLRGPGREPVSFARTIMSHGVAELPPQRVDAAAASLTTTLRIGGRARTVHVRPASRKAVEVSVTGRRPGRAAEVGLVDAVKHMLRLDEDLSEFYALCAEDPALDWVPRVGAGRMMRNPTVFEEVVKTICTTNCTWSATERMVKAFVEHLGEPAAGAPADGVEGRAFPTPKAMAEAGERFYKDVARAGYRGPYFIELARLVNEGEIDLEAWGSATEDELPTDELASRLLALPGVGPYATAHTMMMLGRYSRLILDSWTRPTYARLAGKKVVKDSTIERRFKRFGPFAGLAFWLFLTKGWVED